MNRIFIEAPCFGFGPISTSISLANHLSKQFEIWFITYGEALQFLNKSTKYPYIEIDTRAETEFDRIKSVVSHDDLFIVNTNVEFGTYLIQNKYKVLIVDTLYWMWNNIPDLYANHDYFISQIYYGKSVKEFPTHKECKPIINYDIWNPKLHNDNNRVLISFGGMAEPGDNKFIISAAKEMVECIVEALPHNITDVYVIGGLFDNSIDYFDTNRIHMLGSVDAKTFNAYALNSRYIFLSPGLTSLYEMIYSKIPFCLLPGLSVSQIFQVYQFSHECGYQFCMQWSGTQKLVKLFSSISESEGIDYLRGYIDNIDIRNDIDIQKMVNSYVDAVNKDNIHFDSIIFSQLFEYPTVEDIAMSYLEELKNE